MMSKHIVKGDTLLQLRSPLSYHISMLPERACPARRYAPYRHSLPRIHSVGSRCRTCQSPNPPLPKHASTVDLGAVGGGACKFGGNSESPALPN